jgi:hypothetical protein
MTAIAYNPLNSGTFTDKMLDANFTVIANYTQNLESFLVEMAKTVEGLKASQLQLAKKLPKKRRVLPIVVSAGVGVYVYKRLKKSGLSVKFNAETGSFKVDNVREAAEKAYAETKLRKDVRQTEDTEDPDAS